MPSHWLPRLHSCFFLLLNVSFPHSHLSVVLLSQVFLSQDSCFCPFLPVGKTVCAVHWDLPCVWTHSGEELATLQGVYPEGPRQESGE